MSGTGLQAQNPGLTRREVVGGAAALGAGALLAQAPAVRARPRRRRRVSVAVLGGGVAGLSAAHELALRGFEVTVYERRAFGGKARSHGVPGSGRGGRRPLPGEHGMRFFPGFYQNIPDTMRRIPCGSNPGGTFDNLEAATQDVFARDGGREDLVLPLELDSTGWSPEEIAAALRGFFSFAGSVPPQELEYFIQRLEVFFTSCDARRLAEWEPTSWWEFVAAERFSEDYRRLVVNSVTRQILAAKAQRASARTLGLLWQAFLYNLLGRTGTGAWDRILNAPTNEAWIAPWLAELRRLGVKLHVPAEVRRLHVGDGRLRGATVTTPRGPAGVKADWFVLAVPVERARLLFDRDVLAVAPKLRQTRKLETGWMNAIQFYLREPAPIVHGHILYVDSPWALSSLSQAQFWTGRDFPRDYGDGSVSDCLSVDIGDFTVPGPLYGKPARELGPKQIAAECWEQMSAALNDTGRDQLPDDVLASWALDPGLSFSGPPGRRRVAASADPLMISTPGSWRHRPHVGTAIPNLLLAADYAKVSVDTACMEGANEAARRAVNALLERSRSREDHVAVYELFQPPEYEPLRSADERRFRQGQPNALDTPPPA